MKTYKINEIFYSVQGEGVRSGTANVFVRFSNCNLKCSDSDDNGPDNNVGFNCDTEFESGVRMTAAEIVQAVKDCSPFCKWIVLTGGEPALQLDEDLCDALHYGPGYSLAIETNGTIELPRAHQYRGLSMTAPILEMYAIDWICVSPKSAEHTLRQLQAHEVKYVRNAGQALPASRVTALHYLLSPAFSAINVNGTSSLDMASALRCVELCKLHPIWRLSVQLHKWIRVR